MRKPFVLQDNASSRVEEEDGEGKIQSFLVYFMNEETCCYVLEWMKLMKIRMLCM